MQDFARVLLTGQPASWGGRKDGVDWHVAMQDEAFARRFTAAMDCRGLYLGQALASALDVYSVLLMHASQGKCYAVSEYERMLQDTGFVDVRHQDTVADRGVMTARKRA